MLSIGKLLDHNIKKALEKGVIVGIITTLIYLIVVVVTTPSLQPIAAINAALKINSILIFGLAAGGGAQVFLSSYSKGLGCKIDKKKKGIFEAGSGSSTTISSFFSFFSLVPLGCCGSWLLILSFLPSIFGSALSVILIQYSSLLSYIGLAIVFGFVAISAIRLVRELNERRRIQRIKNANTSDVQETEGSYSHKEDHI
jgi:hypothetical protein